MSRISLGRAIRRIPEKLSPVSFTSVAQNAFGSCLLVHEVQERDLEVPAINKSYLINLTTFCTQIASSMNEGKATSVFYFDCSKVFNTISLNAVDKLKDMQQGRVDYRPKETQSLLPKLFNVSIIIDYYGYNYISYQVSFKEDKEEEIKHIKGGRRPEDYPVFAVLVLFYLL